MVDLGFGPSGSGVQCLGFMQGFVLWPHEAASPGKIDNAMETEVM